MTHRHVTAGHRVMWGADALLSLGVELERIGVRHAAIVCGRSAAEHPDALARIIAAAGGRIATTVDGAVAGSPDHAVEHVRDQLREARADAVIAVGGGSAIVTARAATILLGEGGELRDLSLSVGSDGSFSSPRLKAPKLPQVVIPTTPTTATCKTGAAVTETATNRRLALHDPQTRARAVIVDPELSRAPEEVSRPAVVNAIAMAAEGLLSPSASPFSDALLVKALRMLGADPDKRLADDPDRPVLEVLAAALVGEATNTAQVGLTAACSHALGLWSETPNGVFDAAMLPHVLELNRGTSTRGWSDLAWGLGCTEERVVPTLIALTGTARLRDLGIIADDLPAIADDAMRDFASSQNPRPVRTADVVTLLRSAW